MWDGEWEEEDFSSGVNGRSDNNDVRSIVLHVFLATIII